MTFAFISMKQFVNLVGHIGVECFRRHNNGSSWLLPDGRIASELLVKDKWCWVLTTEV